MKKLGIIAGSGALPGSLIAACKRAGRPFFVLALKGYADPKLLPKDIPVKWIRLGAIGTGFAVMKRQNVEEIVMIGAVRRPSLLELRPDWRGLKFFAKAGIRALGDDGLLRAVIKEIEADGFKVVGADSVVPSLLATKGVYGKVVPRLSDLEDIRRGFDVAKILGKADVGQAVIVQQGLILAVEAIEGTAALIERSRDLKRDGGGGVLVKVVKPGQERRADLPTVGPQTVQAIYNAGFKGIAVEAGSVLLVDASQTAQLADELDIFVVGVDDLCHL